MEVSRDGGGRNISYLDIQCNLHPDGLLVHYQACDCMDLLIYQIVDKQNLSLFQRLISSAYRLAFKRWLLTLSIVLERFSEILYAEPQISLDTLGVTVSCFALHLFAM